MLQGKLCVIVGAVKDAGASIAKQFAAKRCNIAFIDSDKESGKLLKSKLQRDFQVEAFFYHGDINREEDLELFAGAVLEQYGGVDYFINNATLLGAGDECCFDSVKAANQALQVSVTVPYVLDKMFRKHFEMGGVEIYTVPGKEFFSKEDVNLYRFVKESVENLTKMCAQAHKGLVRVNCICMDEMDESCVQGEGLASTVSLLCEEKSCIPNGKCVYADTALWRMMAYPVHGEWKFVF